MENMAELPRRSLLKLLTLAPVAAGALASAGCSVWPGKQSSVSEASRAFGPLLVFSADQTAIVAAMAESCLDRSYAELARAEVIQRLDEELFFVSDSIREDFLLALSVLEYLPIVYGRFSRFSRLPTNERQAFLQARLSTRSETVRAVVHSLRMAVMLSFYGHQSSWDSIAYDGAFAQVAPLLSKQRKYYQQRIVALKQKSDAAEQDG